MFDKRIQTVLSSMEKAGIDQLLVTDPNSIWYLTGYANEPMERMQVLCLRRDGHHTFFLNKLFPAPKSNFAQKWFYDTDDSIAILAEHLNPTDTIGIDKEWTARYLLPLIKQLPNTSFVLASDCVDDARACKDNQERILMREASRINDLVMERTADFLKEGMSESQVAAYIQEQFKAQGCESVSFPPIVSFGGNAADPHHEPDDTILRAGDCIVVDIGCKKNRYCSDMTRTFFCKTAASKYTQLHDIVREATEKAISMVRPGIPMWELDKVARDCIVLAGYGEYFNTRLGHFIGLTDHEKGDVSSASKITAKPGMIFSIEPGIYLPNEFGVRIEDLVLVTDDGCEVLNHVDRHWKIVG